MELAEPQLSMHLPAGLGYNVCTAELCVLLAVWGIVALCVLSGSLSCAGAHAT